MSLLTIKQALNAATQQLQTDNDSARFEAEILLAFCLAKNRAYLLTWPEKTLSEQQYKTFSDVVQRRAGGEPVAYITGHKEFWDLDLRVSPEVLIPRADTERLVELTLDRIPKAKKWRIADLGTGSGAIALAIAKERPNCLVTATDISQSALEIAQHNAKINNISNVEFRHGAWYDPLNQCLFHVIVSNPPYIAANDTHLQKGDLRFEPPHALRSSQAGLHDLQQIISQSIDHLRPPGWLLVEHGYQQGEAVVKLYKKYGFSDVCCHADYAQLERVTLGVFHQPTNI